MTVSFQLPTDLEQRLRRELGDLNQTAKEAALVELYRHGRLTQHELSEALGISRLQVEALLKIHGVTEDLMTVEEFEAELRATGRADR